MAAMFKRPVFKDLFEQVCAMSAMVQKDKKQETFPFFKQLVLRIHELLTILFLKFPVSNEN